MKFYSLLYIDHRYKSLSINGLSNNFEEQITTYIRCCEVLDKSLRANSGYSLTVITNDKQYIQTRSELLDCIQIDFNLNVPEGIPFYSAHFKIDVLKHLGEMEGGGYFFLVDNDMLCMNSIPPNLINCVKDNIPVYYNITHLHYPAYGRETMIINKSSFLGHGLSLGMWAGGEFLGGDSRFFRSLYNEVSLNLSRYFEIYNQLHHQGDEVLISVAIETLLKKGTYICDAGTFGAVARFWSIPVKHKQNNWNAFSDHFLVHLPADKKWIEALTVIDNTLGKKYKCHLLYRYPENIARRALMLVRNFLKKGN